jgi:hypothetical protein
LIFTFFDYDSFSQVSKRLLTEGEQITVDYGPSYWHARGIRPEDL